MAKKIIQVEGSDITIILPDAINDDYFSLTDIAKRFNEENPAALIASWMKNKDTIEFLGVWEKLNNSNFNLIQLEEVKKEAGFNRFVISVAKWVATTNAIGIVSKSGTLTYEAADQIVKAGLGITTAIGIGGDPIIGTPTKDAVELLMNDPDTHGIVMIGEIGGNYETMAARWIKENGNKKPVVGFIAGQTAPPGRRMGHAGAIIGGADDTAAAKMKIMRECGIHVVESPALIGETMAKVIKK